MPALSRAIPGKTRPSVEKQEFNPDVDFMVSEDLKVTVVSPTAPIGGELTTIADSNRIGNLFGYIRSFPSDTGDSGTPSYKNVILCRLKIEPDNAAVQKMLKDKVTVTLEPVTSKSFTSTINWEGVKTVPDKPNTAILAYEGGYWDARVTFDGLPDAHTETSFSRVPLGLHDLLHKKRNAEFKIGGITGGDAGWSQTTQYEMYFGDSFVIGSKHITDTTCNKKTIDELIGSDEYKNIKFKMYEIMNCSTEIFNFIDSNNAKLNFEIRNEIVNNINKVNNNDINFYNPSYHGPQNSDNYFIKDTYYEVSLKKWIIGNYWDVYNKNNIDNRLFISKNNINPYNSIRNSTPFHGECLIVSNMCIHTSFSKIIDESSFDKLYGKFITIGYFNSTDVNQIMIIDRLTYIPGDSIYLHNYYKYIDESKDRLGYVGEWIGENSFCVDNDGIYSYFSGWGVNKSNINDFKNQLENAYYDVSEEHLDESEINKWITFDPPVNEYDTNKEYLCYRIIYR